MAPRGSRSLRPRRPAAEALTPANGLRLLEALLCTLIAQADGDLALHAADVAACGNAYRLGMRPQRPENSIRLYLLAGGSSMPAPRRRGQGPRRRPAGPGAAAPARCACARATVYEASSAAGAVPYTLTYRCPRCGGAVVEHGYRQADAL